MELDLLNLLLVLLSAWLAGSLASRLGYPSVFGELMAGVVFGPPLLGMLHGSEVLSLLAELGVLLMMLYIGMEIDPAEMVEASWQGLLATLGGFIIPFALAYMIVLGFGGSYIAGVFAGITAATTSLAVNSRILLDLKLLDTRIGHVMMAGTLLAEALVLVIFAAVVGVAEAGQFNLTETAFMVGKVLLFFAVTAGMGILVFPYLGRRMAEAGWTDRTFHFTLVLLLAVLFGELAELAGMHAILGAFIAGLFLRDNVLGRSLAEDLMEAVRHASIGFLAPIFFVTAGFAVSFSALQAQLGLLVGLILVALVGKTLGTALFYLPSGHGWREGVAIGAGMNGRGGVDIVIAGLAFEMGLISSAIFSLLVFTAIATTALVPLMIKQSTAWLRRRGELVRTDGDRQGVLIIGAGPVARTLAKVVEETRPVWLIDSNKERCDQAASEGLNMYCGNALQEQTLSEAHAGRASIFIALTSNVEVNALASQLARNTFHIPEICVLPGSVGSGYTPTLKHLNASHLFAGRVRLEEWNHWISHDQTTRSSFTVTEPTPATALFEQLQEEQSSLPLAYKREEMYHPFHANDALQPGDEVISLHPPVPARGDYLAGPL